MYKEIDNPGLVKGKLKREFGVKAVLKKNRVFYDWKDYKLNFNLIEGIGNFLVIEGEDLNQEKIAEELKIEDPEFVTVPFSELKD